MRLVEQIKMTILEPKWAFLLVLALGLSEVRAQSILPATVLRVIDGDTFVAELHLLPDLTRRVRVRVAELDTPELRGQCPEEKRLARMATQRAAELLDGPITLEVGRDRAFDSFGRLLARVRLQDGRYLAEVLIAEGLGRPWTGRRESWC